MLEDDRFSAHYIPDIFVSSSTYQAVSISPHFSSRLAQNILCLLQMMPPEEVSNHLPPPSSFAAPLLAHFPARLC